jgi:hypothetical protein
MNEIHVLPRGWFCCEYGKRGIYLRNAASFDINKT